VTGDDILGWIGIAVALVAAIVLDKGSAPHKWHAAIMWTFVTLLWLLRFGRKKWRSWLFWIFWVVCLALHGVAMWLIFGELLPRLVLGTLYVVPLAFVEALFLIGVFSRLERTLAPGHSRHASDGVRSAQGNDFLL
jgi:hypothetical protein